ncbi:homeodomain-only protein isoform X2 [Anoplolepis gracilipes]|uniref:homeodomain-only protein isoform X2 n=1 Tax=Anoplolepis gracilipes TaxID=354296 RepID=UPI003BA0FE09
MNALIEEKVLLIECFPSRNKTHTEAYRGFSRKNMLKSYPTRFPNSGADGSRVIRLTVDQEAVLQEQFNRWPRTPYTADIVLLAAETGLSEADVEGWYAIRLAQWRKEQGLGGNLGLH